jgi:hypothetical protein
VHQRAFKNYLDGSIGRESQAPLSWPSRSPDFNPQVSVDYLKAKFRASIVAILDSNCGAEFNSFQVQ